MRICSQGSSSSRTQPDPADIVQAKRRAAEKGVADSYAVRSTNALVIVAVSWEGPCGPVTLFLTMGIFDLIILAVNGDEDCRCSALAIMLRTEIIPPCLAHPYLHMHPATFQGPG